MDAWVTKVKASLDSLASEWASHSVLGRRAQMQGTSAWWSRTVGEGLATLIAKGKTGWTSKSLLDNITLLGYRSSIFVIGKLG